MKFHDESQNLRLRLRIIQVVVFALLAVLGVRLYFLQVVNGAYYAERAENQRVRLLPIPAQRGTIFDRNGRILVDSRPIYNVILSREEMQGKDFSTLVAPLSEGLFIDPELLRDRFNELKSQPAFESIIIKQNATMADIQWVEARQGFDHPELRIEQQPQRRYPENGVLAHVLGYVAEVNPKQLEREEYKVKGLKPGDIIGQEGLEATYDNYLRGRDGYRKVIVDSRGRIQDEIEKVSPQPGQDIVTTIDLDLQETAEEQLRNSPSGRGVIISVDPRNGEILVMASAPTFDPNLFSQRIATKAGRAEYAALIKDPRRPLYNRAIRGRYPPGSTWKIPMAVAGLEQGAITTEHSGLVCGGGITVGNKFTRCMGHHGTPELRTAIMHSCDGYFYRLGLKMKLEGIMQMVESFDLNKRTGVDLPHELISWTPSREFKKKFQPKAADWGDIDTVFASFGQVYENMTPLSMLRTIAGISVGGQLYVPHLLREVHAIPAIGEPGKFDYRPEREARTFTPLDSTRPNPKVVPITPEHHRMVVEGMWQVVNQPGGTGGAMQMAGFDVAGKTGTAQVVSLGKDTGENKDHSWFVAYAPAYKPEIASIALIENVGFGGKFAAPATKAVYEVYYRKTRPDAAPQDVAEIKPPKSQVGHQ
ncbi:MAG: penicillin-binding protein 2 [Pyrinomonadaceae bacterium]|nr:penicillin-binding protein 2 [Pyrinomonadaceae bacterium]MDX6269394.1 penicillin-binding protein 2 [Acidobacteriota bacterium]